MSSSRVVEARETLVASTSPWVPIGKLVGRIERGVLAYRVIASVTDAEVAVFVDSVLVPASHVQATGCAVYQYPPHREAEMVEVVGGFCCVELRARGFGRVSSYQIDMREGA